MFKQGNLVKSSLRTKKFPLFLMVLQDIVPHETKFTGIVIKDTSRKFDECECGLSESECFCSEETKTGHISDNWNMLNFEICTWGDIFKFNK